MTYNVFGGTLNPAQSNPVTLVYCDTVEFPLPIVISDFDLVSLVKSWKLDVSWCLVSR